MRYRDWVIRAFNDNLGYDDFVRYQLAGDLFPDPSRDQLVASGFHRLHLIIDRGTALPEESFTKNVFDRVAAVGTAFMGLTLNCAQCHDHKFDPITQKDYYAMFAFFNNLDAEPETTFRPRQGLQAPFISFATEEQKQKLADLNEQIADKETEIKAIQEKIKTIEEAEQKKPLEESRRAMEQQRDALKKKRDRFDDTIPKAMVMKERTDVRSTYVLNRGQYDQPGQPVTRGTPGFLPPLKKGVDVASRMDLAQWMVDPQNPLTARVAVNRFWQQLFGVGIVKTSEDLGAQGEVPSHPQLLDYLSSEFVESGWDIKALMKHLVMSKTYRQSSIASAEQFRQDPENRLLGRGSRYRMDAEMIRDQILATSGLLVEKMYGPSVKPPQPDGLWQAVTMTGQRFKSDRGESIYRRSIYTFWKRAMPPPQMTILNAPIRDACIARRERTNTPTQALLLLNESEYLKAARHLARRILRQQPTERLSYAWEMVTGRLPDESERNTLESLLTDLLEKYRADPELARELCHGINLPPDAEPSELAAWTVVGNLLFNLDITKTKE